MTPAKFSDHMIPAILKHIINLYRMIAAFSVILRIFLKLFKFQIKAEKEGASNHMGIQGKGQWRIQKGTRRNSPPPLRNPERSKKKLKGRSFCRFSGHRKDFCSKKQEGGETLLSNERGPLLFFVPPSRNFFFVTYVNIRPKPV